MQMLRMISGLVFLIRPLCAVSRLLIRPVAAIIRGVRPTTALMRACYVLLGIVLLFGAWHAEQGGQRDYAIALAAAGAILLVLRRTAPLVAMRGTVRWFNAMKGLGCIVPDDGQDMLGHDEPLLVHVSDIIGFGPWFRECARVAFRTKGKGEIGRCLRVVQEKQGASPGVRKPAELGATIHDMVQMPSDLLKSGWTRKGVAANRHGEPVLSDDPAATAWSLCGAVNAVYEADLPPWKLYMAALRARVGHNIVRWNGDSGRTQADVVAVALEVEEIVRERESGGGRDREREEIVRERDRVDEREGEKNENSRHR